MKSNCLLLFDKIRGNNALCLNTQWQAFKKCIRKVRSFDHLTNHVVENPSMAEVSQLNIGVKPYQGLE